MMELYLYRTRTRQLTTDGVLRSSDGQRICDTAEFTPLRLPPGTYQVIFKKHPKYQRRTPYILPSQGWVESSNGVKAEGWVVASNGVFLHDFGSSIAVGDHLVPGVVLNTQRYFRQLVKRLEKALKRKREVMLVIK